MGWPGVHERIHCRVLTNIYLGPWDPGAEPAGCQAAELPLHSVGAPGTAAPWQGWESAWPASCLPAWVPGEEAAHRGRQTAVRSPRLTEHSYFPCAADREFTFILVTGLFSFS